MVPGAPGGLEAAEDGEDVLRLGAYAEVGVRLGEGDGGVLAEDEGGGHGEAPSGVWIPPQDVPGYRGRG